MIGIQGVSGSSVVGSKRRGVACLRASMMSHPFKITKMGGGGVRGKAMWRGGGASKSSPRSMSQKNTNNFPQETSLLSTLTPVSPAPLHRRRANKFSFVGNHCL